MRADPGRPATLRLAVCLGLLAALGCAAPGPTRSPRDAARIASEVRDWRRASALWHDLWVASGYVDGEAARGAAEALAASGDRAGGLALLRAQLARAADDAASWTALGVAELVAGDAARARASLERALALEPRDTRAATGLAQLYREAGEHARALAVVQAATRAAAGVPDAAALGPDAGADAWLEVARAALALGSLEEACAAYGEAFARGPAPPDDALRLARALAAQLERLEAPAEDRAGDPADAGSELAASTRAWRHHAERARGWLDAGRAERPNRSELHAAAARLELALGAPERALDPARRALELEPGDVAAMELLFRALVDTGRPDDARRVVEHGLALDLVGDERARLTRLATLQ